MGLSMAPRSSQPGRATKLAVLSDKLATLSAKLAVLDAKLADLGATLAVLDHHIGDLGRQIGLLGRQVVRCVRSNNHFEATRASFTKHWPCAAKSTSSTVQAGSIELLE